MNYNPQDLPLDKSTVKGYKKIFSRISLALFAYTLTSFAFVNLVYLLLAYLKAPFVDSVVFVVLLSNAANYGIGFAVFYLLIKNVPKEAPNRVKMRAGELFGLFCVAMLAVQLGSNISTTLINFIYSLSEVVPPNTLQETVSELSLPLTFLLVCIIAPICEEFIFRKILIPRLLPFGEATAILFSAGAFALYHGNFYQLFYTFGFGLVCGYVFVKTGKTVYSILLHIAFNLFGSFIPSLILSLINQDALNQVLETMDMSLLSPSDMSGFMLLGLYGLLDIGLVIFGIVYFFKSLKLIRFAKGKNHIPRENKGEIIFFNAGTISLIVIFTLLIALNTVSA